MGKSNIKTSYEYHEPDDTGLQKKILVIPEMSITFINNFQKVILSFLSKYQYMYPVT